ncbi:NACHT domain-containing protein [Streptomyces cinnabarinus]|uniref:NACHT domain-containing protein n=1 Tax=Streptomyces cinnabarinus TaxID=67287 RepID=A0ABY7KU17_9ACTN|nr:NACHT domain-containing protein [Streptomyces cinnabarinus]WAZ26907.1 NACHT domain-containing protein [Streptomyces cinnabarinus]
MGINAYNGAVAALHIDRVEQHVRLEDPLTLVLNRLRQTVRAHESAECFRLLGEDVARIDLAYTLRPEANREAKGAALHGRLTASGEGIHDVAAYYRAITPRRLVVTGAPGAGKTVLALDLIVALTGPDSVGQPVPVRLSTAAWDTSVPLDAHLTEHLIVTYRVAKDDAERLVTSRLVLPVLDGLDEMDETLPNGEADPRAPRATAVLNALNSYLDGTDLAAVILTCRTRHLDALVENLGAQPRRQLLRAARIEIVPVDAPDAVSYLRGRTTEPARWELLLRALEDAPDGTLARSLSTPWRLCLIATVFRDTGDPCELLRHAKPDELDQFLLARYLPRVVAQHNAAGGHRRYPPDRVHRWLHQIASYLEHPRPEQVVHPDEHSRTDIDPYRLWPLANWSLVAEIDCRVPYYVGLYGLLCLSGLVALAGVPSDWVLGGPAIVLFFLNFGLGRSHFSSTTGRLVWAGWAQIDCPREQRRRRGAVAVAVLGGVGGGFCFAMDGPLPQSLLTGAAVALFTTLYLLLVSIALQKDPSPAVRPRRLMRGDIRYRLLLGLANGGMIGSLAAGFSGVKAGVSVGLVCGLGMCGLLSGTAVRRYVVFVSIARCGGKLPLRLGAFLDWALDAGLLRLSGSVYQFRHRELQHWLAAHPPQRPSRSR